jgi:hypothetical protein
MAFRRTAALVLIWCASTAPTPASGPATLPDVVVRAVERVSADDLRHYVRTLASDDFGGRGIGDPGNRAAEEFACDILRKNSVLPAGADGSCYQPIEIYRPALGSNARLTVFAADGSVIADLRGGADFYPLPDSGNANVTGPLVFARHGITAPDLRHDDFAGLDVRGAIVMVLDGAPDKIRDDRANVADKVANAAAHGARGLVIIAAYLPGAQAIWPEQGSTRSAAYRLASEVRADPTVATLSGKAAQPIQDALTRDRNVTATLTPDLTGTTVIVRNVLGIVEGRDAARRGEMVVVGAHLDHDGTDAQGRIYNGADDNASGTAAVLAAATAVARAAADGERPARSIVFALWNGEEKGSLGAHAFAAAPQPARRVVANLNLDMVGRHEDIPDPSDWRFAGMRKVSRSASANTLHVLGYSYSPDLAASLRAANQAVGLALLEDYDQGAQGLLRRSDNWAFLSRGIPALFLTTGLHPDYHTPDDDVERIDFGKLTRVAQLAARAAWIVADGAEPTLRKR